MHIQRPQFIPQTVAEPSPNVPVPPPVEQPNGPVIASDTPVTRSRREVAATPGLSSRTVEASRLDRVDDPKLEIKKEATSPNGLFAVSYSIPVAGSGLNNITFPMIIDEGLQRKTAQDPGIYYAMLFDVSNEQGKSLDGGYIGIQPRQDGKALVMFSGFGSHFSAPKGRAEADGGEGGSNSTLVDFEFGHKYNLTVTRDPDNPQRLKGYIQDVTDPAHPGVKQHVEDLDVDQKFVLAASNTGFVEHYGADISRSSQIAPTRGSFFAPFTTEADGTVKAGEVRSDGFYGRYKNAMIGDQEVTKVAGKGQEVYFTFQGAGYGAKA
ncbi:hypothetical protein [Pseudomonas sp. QC2]|uniref:hypothetical protein n=1 Tax=Pseudomonas sp. QC2 TaxID=2065822 RepID=UPI002114186D|nr:hypothetical protein [Pseudomonas sp. QC2]